MFQRLVSGQLESGFACEDHEVISKYPSSLRYVENEDPEWRELDYDVEVISLTR